MSEASRFSISWRVKFSLFEVSHKDHNDCYVSTHTLNKAEEPKGNAKYLTTGNEWRVWLVIWIIHDATQQNREWSKSGGSGHTKIILKSSSPSLSDLLTGEILKRFEVVNKGFIYFIFIVSVLNHESQVTVFFNLLIILDCYEEFSCLFSHTYTHLEWVWSLSIWTWLGSISTSFTQLWKKSFRTQLSRPTTRQSVVDGKTFIWKIL